VWFYVLPFQVLVIPLEGSDSGNLLAIKVHQTLKNTISRKRVLPHRRQLFLDVVFAKSLIDVGGKGRSWFGKMSSGNERTYIYAIFRFALSPLLVLVDKRVEGIRQ
jgi:hypothetical protein